MTTEAWAAIGLVTAQNLLSVLDGSPIKAHAVNPEVWAGRLGGGMSAGPA